MSIYLGTVLPPGASQPTYPHVAVTVYTDVSEPGTTIRWSEPTGEVGSAWSCATAGGCQRATSATVSFLGLTGREDLAGRVTLQFEDGTAVVGGFRATLLPMQAVCG